MNGESNDSTDIIQLWPFGKTYPKCDSFGDCDFDQAK